jgi:hypothetical protein
MGLMSPVFSRLRLQHYYDFKRTLDLSINVISLLDIKNCIEEIGESTSSFQLERIGEIASRMLAVLFMAVIAHGYGIISCIRYT